MQLRSEQLAARLQKGLAPVYLVTGDEPLQHAEAADAIRAAAREQGYSAREVHDAGNDFDWNRLSESADSLSLFADQRLVDLRVPSGKPGRDGGAALVAWSERPPPDTVLLVTMPRIDPQSRRSKWYRALDKIGVTVPVWPIDLGQLPDWIGRRMRARGLQPSADAVSLLAARCEGNLLAAAQEIDKLLLLGGPGAVDVERVAEVVADSARWSIFDFADALIDGEPARVARVIAGLRGEGTQPPVLVWALHRELSMLAGAAARCAQGQAPEAALEAAGVWERRRPRVRRALERLGVDDWERSLASCARLDRLAKGAAQGSFWDELIELGVTVCGRQGRGSDHQLAPRRTVIVER